MSKPTSYQRPRPNCFVQIDLNNLYALLGVSPLDTTQEIMRVINEKLREQQSQQGSKSESAFSDADEKRHELNEIANQIGAPKVRASYDREHPQNELLTVQRCPYDHFDEPHSRAGIVTAWLVETLGRERPLPTAECIAFWKAPPGVARSASPTDALPTDTTEAAKPPVAAQPPAAAAAWQADPKVLDLQMEQLQKLADDSAKPPKS